MLAPMPPAPQVVFMCLVEMSNDQRNRQITKDEILCANSESTPLKEDMSTNLSKSVQLRKIQGKEGLTAVHDNVNFEAVYSAWPLGAKSICGFDLVKS
eukprot:scaffold144968_cov18-Prasinocladus_malaysianus.AAC.1